MSDADSVRTRIRDALIYQLGRIQRKNGYRTDVGDVVDEGISVEQMKNFPTLVISFRRERTLNFMTQQQTWVKQTKELQIYVDAFLNEHNSIGRARDRVLQDVERVIGVHHGLEHEDGNCTVSQCEVVNSTPWGLRINKPNGGISIELLARYNQLRTDPTVRA